MRNWLGRDIERDPVPVLRELTGRWRRQAWGRAVNDRVVAYRQQSQLGAEGSEVQPERNREVAGKGCHTEGTSGTWHAEEDEEGAVTKLLGLSDEAENLLRLVVLLLRSHRKPREAASTK